MERKHLLAAVIITAAAAAAGATLGQANIDFSSSNTQPESPCNRLIDVRDLDLGFRLNDFCAQTPPPPFPNR